MSNLNFSQKSKILKFKSDFLRWKRLVFFLWKRRISPPRNLVIFIKNIIINQWYQLQKHEKYLKLKNDPKMSLRAFNKELWANLKIRKCKIDVFKGISKFLKIFWHIQSLIGFPFMINLINNKKKNRISIVLLNLVLQ